MSKLSKRSPINSSKKTTPEFTEEPVKQDLKRLNTNDLYMPIEHEGIDQKKGETVFVIDEKLWNNTPVMLYDAICALVTKVDQMSELNKI